jgi:hypothetical protein
MINANDLKPDNTWYNVRNNFIKAYFSLEFINVEDMFYQRWRSAYHIAKSLIAIDGNDVKVMADQLKLWREANGHFSDWRAELLAMAEDLLFCFEPTDPEKFFEGDEVNKTLFTSLNLFWEEAYCTKFWIDIAQGRREHKHSEGNQPWLADMERDRRSTEEPKQLKLF